MKVPIRNLYYLLCFAWKYVPEDIAFDVSSLEGSKDVIDLCGYVLANGIDHLLRRGLDRGYLLMQEQTSRLRGRIQLTQTVKQRMISSPTAVCEFDEFSPNILQNQILRSTVASLLRSTNLNSETRIRLEVTYRKLAGIDTIPITNSLFGKVQLHRNNRHYAFLLFVCHLLHTLKLPGTDACGNNRFNDLLDDEKTMERVFEEFLRNFYKFKQTEFRDVNAAYLEWDALPTGDGSLTLLPEMKTDIRLRNSERTIIADAKYYKDALQEHFGTKKAHSGNLYQLLAYLRAESASNPSVRPEGILIYPVGESTIDASYSIDGFSVRLYTLKLDQDWEKIEYDLLSLIRTATTDIPATETLAAVE